jgi:RNA polymerase-binding protein DksA
MAVKTAVKSRAKKKLKAKPGKKAKPAVRAAVKAKPKAQSAQSAQFREQLLAEQARLEEELQEIERRAAHVDESDRASEPSSYEDHPADLASETFEREKDLAIGESVEHMLHKVINALEKIDRGTYGRCDACSKPIKKARLRALPFATLCLDCQDRLES